MKSRADEKDTNNLDNDLVALNEKLLEYKHITKTEHKKLTQI